MRAPIAPDVLVVGLGPAGACAAAEAAKARLSVLAIERKA
ncbi:MAG: FAD-binding protein, partial [Rhizobiales bacterium]|nr:FAD-binding protein [Hyphomicrobiales bacterium]